LKYLFAVAVALGLAFAAYGAAATFPGGVNGGTIQAGEDENLLCSRIANVLGWGYESNDQNVYFVRLAIGDQCVGNDIIVTITQDGVVLDTLSETIAGDECNGEPAGNICVKLDFSAPIPATDITDIHVAIEGPEGTPDQGPPGP
jgi:hypothetical protein